MPAPAHPPPDPFDCYELCVQSPAHTVDFLRAAHARDPVTLREDFCGSAAIARHWILSHRALSAVRPLAIATDLDPAALSAARCRAAAAGIGDYQLSLVRADCFAPSPPPPIADIVFAGNFSLGYAHDRAALLTYLRHARTSLPPGGLFAADAYGGPALHLRGGSTRTKLHPLDPALLVYSVWRREPIHPRTNLVTNTLSFRITRSGDLIAEYPDAFTYRWRIWSLPELTDALLEAGFDTFQFHDGLDFPSSPARVAPPDALPPDWVVLLTARPCGNAAF